MIGWMLGMRRVGWREVLSSFLGDGIMGEYYVSEWWITGMKNFLRLCACALFFTSANSWRLLCFVR